MLVGTAVATVVVTTREPVPRVDGPRGWKQAELSCPDPDRASRRPAVGTGAAEALPDDVSEYRLCPSTRLPDRTLPEPATVQAGDPRFDRLEEVISTRDAEPRDGVTCALYRERFRVLWAHAGDGWYLVHLPLDVCEHYRPELKAVLERIRSS